MVTYFLVFWLVNGNSVAATVIPDFKYLGECIAAGKKLSPVYRCIKQTK